jgi:hypothetical protein
LSSVSALAGTSVQASAARSDSRKIDTVESLALLATPKLSEGGSAVERVDDIFGYDWVAHSMLVRVRA